ncbi:hypothetical protein GCM10008934_39700 [Virgibacillus salarius]
MVNIIRDKLKSHYPPYECNPFSTWFGNGSLEQAKKKQIYYLLQHINLQSETSISGYLTGYVQVKLLIFV